MRENSQAFYVGNIYLLAGVLFQKQQIATTDLSNELVQVLTSL
jgi:hypothetical protein